MPSYHDIIDFLNRSWLIELMAIFLFVMSFNLIAKKSIKHFQNRFKEKNQIWLANFFEAFYAPLSFFVWIFAFTHVARAAKNYFGIKTLITPAEESFLTIAIALCIGWFLLSWKKQMVHYFAKKSKAKVINLDFYRIDALDKLLSIIIIFILLIFILDVIGEGFGTLLTIGGIGAAAIGFASKEFIANFFGGFTIYLNTPFFIGDIIEISGRAKGTVEEIGWYLTRIRDTNKQAIFIPNAQFAQFIVVNLSNITHRRFETKIDLRYEDILKIKTIINDIKNFLINHSEIDQNQRTLVNFTAFAESSLEIKISAYTKTTDLKTFNSICENILLDFYTIIKNNEADFAFPTITLANQV